MYVYVYMYIYIYRERERKSYMCIYIYISNRHKGSNLGPSCLGPKLDPLRIVFLAPTYKTHFQHVLIIFNRFCEIKILTRGLRPSNYNFFDIKFNQLF